jgi:hypothetical protein
MSGRLYWRVEGEAVRFRCEEGGRPLPVERWAEGDIRVDDGRTAQTGVLLAMVDADEATVSETRESILVPGRGVAKLEPWEARGLGLPDGPPFRLRVERQGLITDSGFRIQYSFLDSYGHPVAPVSRTGPIITAVGREFTLHNPIYDLVIAIEGLAASRAGSFEERAPDLQRVQSIMSDVLGGEVSADEYMREISIARAESFTLRPRLLSNGDIDFDVQPASTRPGGTTERALPPAREAEWNQAFRRLPVRGCYPAGRGHYVVIPPEVQKALAVTKQMLSASRAQKREFVRNPRPYLREALPDLPEAALESLFWEAASYGERVREIGLWQPRVLPFLKREGNRWLPEEAMGLQVGSEMVTIPAGKTAEVLSRLEAARAAGEASIEHEGHPIPVTDEAIEAVRELIRIAQVFGTDTVPRTGHESESESSDKVVLLIQDNLEDGGYRRSWAPRDAPRRHEAPEAIRTNLYDFQHRGYQWLQALWLAGSPGALLADDMGLGKTLQTLAFLAWLRETASSNGSRPAPILTIAPTGLLRNWLAEHDRHVAVPGFGGIVEAHGAGLADLRTGEAAGGELLAGLPTLDLERLRRADWVLTTYETARDYQHSFGAVRWGVLVLDEAQKVKNPEALMTEAVKALNAEFTIALTGTPVENRLADLWCIVDTVEPGRLGSLKEFVSTYEAGEHGADASRLEELKVRLSRPEPAVLQRRTKRGELSGLPELTYHVKRIPMPPVQANAYESAVQRARQGGKGQMLKVLQDLRAVSLHPRLELRDSDPSFVADSARLDHTMQILREIQAAREKALVFVEARAMQAALIELLQRQFRLSEPPPVISGDVAGSRRLSRVEAFEKEPGFGVMILSPKAGGVGLTITAANHVIHLSRWWNPAVEDQATDRVYRIGQKRPVHVYTPLAVHPRYADDSFDVRLHELLTRKRSLSQELLAPPEATNSELENLYQQIVQ